LEVRVFVALCSLSLSYFLSIDTLPVLVLTIQANNLGFIALMNSRSSGKLE
jgi:hypothetical protein